MGERNDDLIKRSGNENSALDLNLEIRDSRYMVAWDLFSLSEGDVNYLDLNESRNQTP